MRTACLVAALGLAFAVQAQSPIRTLQREADPLVITAAQAGAISARPLSGYRVFAVSAGRVRAVPFQLDERNRKGDYVFSNGREKNPRDGNGVFDGRDELVLMARDAGDRARPGDLPPGFAAGAELRVSDPVDSGQGFFYLLYFEQNPPPRSADDYVAIDPQTSRIAARNYFLGFSRKAPMALDELGVTPAGGGDNVDYCDRLKARVHLKIWNTIAIDKNEEDFTSEMAAWIDGPVRVIRRTRSRLILFWNIPSPSAVFDNLYYYSSFSFPTSVTLPFDAGKIVSEGSFRVSIDSPRLSGQRRYRNSNWPEGVIQDGVMSEAEKKLAADPRPFTWSATGNPGPDGRDHGGWFNRLKVMDDNPRFQPRVYYVDDLNHADPPDEEPGSYGNGGYQVSDLQGLPAGTYTLVSVMYNAPAFAPEDAPRYLDILDHPLRVTVSPWR
jgi:hypothetical protein